MAGAARRPSVAAHRGASGRHPENTAAAVRAALAAGAHLVEIDVQLTRDGHVVVLHDPTVDRTTDGKGRVCDLTLEELGALDAGAFKGEQFRGERIPTLASILPLFMDKASNPDGAKLLIEIKFSIFSWSGGFLKAIPGLAEATLAVIQGCGAQKVVIVQSFLEDNLAVIRSAEPEIPVHLLVFPWRRLSRLLHLDVDSFNPSVRFLSKSFVAQAHAAGKQVHVWTVDRPEDMGFCLHAGVDGLITNLPDEALSYSAVFDHSAFAPPAPRFALYHFYVLASTVALAAAWTQFRWTEPALEL